MVPTALTSGDATGNPDVDGCRMGFPSKVKVVEVGPGDGLRNETATLSTPSKIALVDRLTGAGIMAVEVGGFVATTGPRRSNDTAKVLAGIASTTRATFSVLAPGMVAFEAAVAAGAREIGVHGAVTDGFSDETTGFSVEEGLNRSAAVCEAAKARGMGVRGTVACVLGCPFEGEVPAAAVAGVAARLLAMGCHEIVLEDTIGKGFPEKVEPLIDAVVREVPVERLAVHFHDSFGQALPNILAAVNKGVAIVESAVSGIGTCYYTGAESAHVATEDVLHMLEGRGIETGIDLGAVAAAGRFVCQALNRETASRVARVLGGGR